MSLLVSSSIANLPTSSAPAVASVTGGNANPQTGDAGNFGQVLNRSLAGNDNSAEAPPDQIVKTSGRSGAGPKRQAGSASKQEAAASSDWAFMALPQAAAKMPDASNDFGDQGQPQSAAENQLNAALAAAGGKNVPLASAAPVAADAPPGKDDPISAVQAQRDSAATSLAGTPRGQHAEALKQGGPDGPHGALAQGPEQLIAKAVSGDTTGQQASRDDNRNQRNDKLEKLDKQDRQANADIRHTDTAATATSAASTTARGHDPAAAGSSQFVLEASAPLHAPIAVSQTISNAANTTMPTPVSPKLPLTPPVGSAGWGAALGKQMIWMGNSGNQTAELHLNPPDLGPLKVTLTINDNQAQAMFVSAHQSVRAAVEAALPQLRTNLADNGISLGNTSVSADTQQQSAFAQQQGAQDGSRSNFQRNSGHGASADTQVVTERNTAPVSRRSNNGNVDTFA